jgi:Aspartyl protease/PDZ domain
MRVILLIIIFLSSFFCPSLGQDKEKFGFQILKNRKTTRIPFELQANLIIVPVKINNSDTLHFILDTGVSSIILTDPKIAKKLDLKPIRSIKISGAGEGLELIAGVSIGHTIKMGDMVGYRQNIIALENDVLALSEFVGTPIHGIIGYDIFNRFVVTIDFISLEITLENPEHYNYKPSKGERLPITIEDSKPYLSGIEVIDNEKVTPLKVIIDTGAGHALSVDASRISQVAMPLKTVKAQLGRGLSGIINGSLGRIPRMKLGKFELKDIVTSFPDSASVVSKTSPLVERQGNIGCELLRRFKVTFNYRDQYIVLKPINRRMKEPFEHNMTGLEIMAKGENFQDFTIERIIEDSPASKAGLREGDYLMFIDNKYHNQLTISEIYKIFQKGEGKQITFIVRRAGEMIYANLTLRRVI